MTGDTLGMLSLVALLGLLLLVGGTVTEQKRQHSTLKQFAYFLRPPSALLINPGNDPDLTAIAGATPEGVPVADVVGTLPRRSGLLILVDPTLEASWWLCQELKVAPESFAGEPWLLVVKGSALSAQRLIHHAGTDNKRMVLVGEGDAVSGQLAIRFNPAAVLVRNGFAVAKGQISTAAHVSGFVRNAQHALAEAGREANFTKEVSVR